LLVSPEPPTPQDPGLHAGGYLRVNVSFSTERFGAAPTHATISGLSFKPCRVGKIAGTNFGVGHSARGDFAHAPWADVRATRGQNRANGCASFEVRQRDFAHPTGCGGSNDFGQNEANRGF